MNYIKAVQTWGVKETFKKFFTLKQIKFGTLVGVDENGNKYFENLNEPYGQHRWVEPPYAVHGSSWDASNISPAWHPWIHCATDKVPTSAVPQGETGVHIVDGVDTPVRHHINLDHRKPWRPNPTLHRERGHNVDHSSGKAGENDYYVQPGHVASPLFEEKGPKIESWGGLPTDDSASHVGEPKKEKSRWELFYEQRQRMNQQ